MTASDSPSYHRTHPDRDLISEAIASERRERRLRIVEAMTPHVLQLMKERPSSVYDKLINDARHVVDMLESLIEPTEGKAQ